MTRPLLSRTFFVVFVALCATVRLNAQCPATLSVTGPDANGVVTVIAGTTGECGTGSVHLKLDGGTLADADCPNPAQCSLTTTIQAGCMGAFDPSASMTHTVSLTTACSHNGTDEQGHPICRPDTAGGSNTSSFTISPRPMVAVNYSGPD